MALIRRDLGIDVVTAARDRVIRAFDNGLPVYLGISGGKDSIALSQVVYELILEGRVDPKLLTVDFIDEEAMFDDVIEIVADWRRKFLLAGAQFRWWCIEVKHYSCFNMLTNDESFITWDREAADVWVRQPPEFAIRDHPMLRSRKETYQDFMRRIEADGVVLVGLRVAESVQRLHAVASSKADRMLYPIYDWKDTDVWRFIGDRGLEFPVAYMNLYALGSTRREMRLSQFFSIDTAKVLVRLAEHYPDLMTRVTKREPNAYLASLYWDSELFRRIKVKKEAARGEEELVVDWRAKTLEFIGDPANLNSDVRRRNFREAQALVIRFGDAFDEQAWRTVYQALVAGDPKSRTLRALRAHLLDNRWKARE